MTKPGHATSTMELGDDDCGIFSVTGSEMSIGQQVEEMMDSHPNNRKPSRKFSRIRTFVQKLNEEFLVTLYQTEQRHKADAKALRDKIESLDEKNEALQYKIKTLLAQEQEHLVLVKQAGERIKKLEAQEANNKLLLKKSGEKITVLESKLRHQHDDRLKQMEIREQKVIALAKKAATKIKQLEARAKEQASHAEEATSNIKKLKQMILDKHDELENVQHSALKELNIMARELASSKTKSANLHSFLEEAKKNYIDEHELRKADQKKIHSLRKMIEQYDDGAETDLSNAFSEEDGQLEINPLTIYRVGDIKTPEDFDELRGKIHGVIPDSIKRNFQQVGFFEASDSHFPVLALGPFDVPPGSLREKWLEKANTSLGIYYYGQKDDTLAYDMIPAESFIPYDEGVEKNFHILAMDIQQKVNESAQLSPLEQMFEDGIKMINAHASSEPQERVHPLKNFAEIFEQEQQNTYEQPNFSLGVNPEAMLAKLRNKICTCTDAKEQLLEELKLIKEEAQLATSTKAATEKKPVASEKKPLIIDVSSPAHTPGVDSGIADSFDTEGGETMSSLEEQMHNFMSDLNAGRTPRATPKINSPVTAEVTKKEVHCEEAPRVTGTTAVVHGSEVARKPQAAETREWHVSEGGHGAEIRDDVVASKPSYEKIPTNLVKDRLKMFNAGKQSDNGSRSSYASVGNTKNVMQMWKHKAAGTTTPKQGNTTPKNTFNFNTPTAQKSNKDDQSVRSVSSKSSAKTRCVTIPMNILKKIEAGETLSNHEREILEGIQKFNQTPSASSVSHANNNNQQVDSQESTLSALTSDATTTSSKLVSAE